jgi:hypothetical protein
MNKLIFSDHVEVLHSLLEKVVANSIEQSGGSNAQADAEAAARAFAKGLQAFDDELSKSISASLPSNP